MNLMMKSKFPDIQKVLRGCFSFSEKHTHGSLPLRATSSTCGNLGQALVLNDKDITCYTLNKLLAHVTI